MSVLTQAPMGVRVGVIVTEKVDVFVLVFVGVDVGELPVVNVRVALELALNVGLAVIE